MKKKEIAFFSVTEMKRFSWLLIKSALRSLNFKVKKKILFDVEQSIPDWGKGAENLCSKMEFAGIFAVFMSFLFYYLTMSAKYLL